MSTIDVVRAELAAWDADRPRSQQVETGASQVFGCRAESVLRLSGIPESDPRSSWPAKVGTAIHSMFETAARHGDPTGSLLLEHRVMYHGVPATVDRYDPATKRLTDYKTKDDDADVRDIARHGPDREHQAQIHLGAAGLIEEGHEVDTVELLYVPRAGLNGLDDAYLYSVPFDRQLADEAAEWVASQIDRADDMVVEVEDGHLVGDPLEGLRDKMPSWCRQFCEYHTLCRGPEALPALDDRLVGIAAEYYDAKTRQKEAEAELKHLRPELDGIQGEGGGLTVSWSGGNTKLTEQPDVERALEEYAAFIGPVPTKQVTTVTARQLRVEKTKPKKKP